MSTEYFNNPEQPNRTISIIGFGGLDVGLPAEIGTPQNITGTFRRYARTDYSNGTSLEHAVITITREQKIVVGSKTVVLEVGKIYELKGNKDTGYKLINNRDSSLTVRNTNIRTGGKRKHLTKRKRATRRTQKRRS
jgi:hypothetical protein